MANIFEIHPFLPLLEKRLTQALKDLSVVFQDISCKQLLFIDDLNIM
jgi:hypothetical protein